MNHLYEAVNFQTRGKKEALVDLIWSILCVSSARRQTPHTWYSGYFYLCLTALCSHVTWVPSLCLLLCLYTTSLRVSDGFKPLNCSLE